MDVGRRKRREEGEGGKKRSTRGLGWKEDVVKQQWYSDRTHETLEQSANDHGMMARGPASASSSAVGVALGDGIRAATVAAAAAAYDDDER